MTADYVTPKVQYIRPPYPPIEGSSALQPAVTPYQRIRTRMAAKKREGPAVIEIDLLSWVSVVLAIIMLCLMLTGWSELQQARKEQQVMQDYVLRLEQENIRLENEYYSEIDLEYIRECALALGMVPIEEVEHITIYLTPNIQAELCCP